MSDIIRLGPAKARGPARRGCGLRHLPNGLGRTGERAYCRAAARGTSSSSFVTSRRGCVAAPNAKANNMNTMIDLDLGDDRGADRAGRRLLRGHPMGSRVSRSSKLADGPEDRIVGNLFLTTRGGEDRADRRVNDRRTRGGRSARKRCAIRARASSPTCRRVVWSVPASVRSGQAALDDRRRPDRPGQDHAVHGVSRAGLNTGVGDVPPARSPAVRRATSPAIFSTFRRGNVRRPGVELDENHRREATPVTPRRLTVYIAAKEHPPDPSDASGVGRHPARGHLRRETR